MTEVWFYHLQARTMEQALPALIERGRARGWRMVVQLGDESRLKAVDDLLWTYEPESFLPHGTDKDGDPARQPILLTCADANANGAALRICAGGAAIGDAIAGGGYERIILLFDGRDEAELGAARRQWTQLKGTGADLAYWRQGDDGRWTRQS